MQVLTGEAAALRVRLQTQIEVHPRALQKLLSLLGPKIARVQWITRNITLMAAVKVSLQACCYLTANPIGTIASPRRPCNCCVLAC